MKQRLFNWFFTAFSSSQRESVTHLTCSEIQVKRNGKWSLRRRSDELRVEIRATRRNVQLSHAERLKKLVKHAILLLRSFGSFSCCFFFPYFFHLENSNATLPSPQFRFKFKALPRQRKNYCMFLNEVNTSMALAFWLMLFVWRHRQEKKKVNKKRIKSGESQNACISLPVWSTWFFWKPKAGCYFNLVQLFFWPNLCQLA